MSGKLGPYELNSIVTGECSELMAELPADSIDLTVTSPPYDNLREYEGYTFDFPAIARQLYRVTKPGGVVVWVVADETKDGSESGTSFRQALGFMELGFRLHDTMIFYKGGNGAAGSHYTYWQEFEYMLVFSKGQPEITNLIRDRHNAKTSGKNGRQRRGENARPERWETPKNSKRGNVWFYSTGMNCGTKDDTGPHTAFFPEALARDHILSWSNPGDIVLDPMIGSGTVAKMAYLTGRNFLGFEISEKYATPARRRVEMAMSQPALFNPYQPPLLLPQPVQLDLGVSDG